MIGSHLLYELAVRGMPLRSVSRDPGKLSLVKQVFSIYAGNDDELVSNIDWRFGDIRDEGLVDEITDGIELIYHTAAMVSFYPANKKRMKEINVEGTALLVNNALHKGVRKFCHVSSVATLGNRNEQGCINEDSYWKPFKNRSYYARSKFLSELEVWRAMAEGLQAVIVNPSVVIGPGDWNARSGRLISTVNKGLRFYPGGMTGFVDVKDVVRCMIALMDSPVTGERFIISSSELSYKNVFKIIAGALNKKAPEKRVSSLMLEAAWRAAFLWSLISGSGPAITKEIIRAGQQKTCYSNNKIRKILNADFITVERSLKETSAIFYSGFR